MQVTNCWGVNPVKNLMKQGKTYGEGVFLLFETLYTCISVCGLLSVSMTVSNVQSSELDRLLLTNVKVLKLI